MIFGWLEYAQIDVKFPPPAAPRKTPNEKELVIIQQDDNMNVFIQLNDNTKCQEEVIIQASPGIDPGC
jgi:hypothetical protein